MRVLKADIEKLTTLRVQNGFSITALAKRAGVNYLVLMRLENGKNGTRPENACKIAKALNVNVNDLFAICIANGKEA